jgi:hypothetical protein
MSGNDVENKSGARRVSCAWVRPLDRGFEQGNLNRGDGAGFLLTRMATVSLSQASAAPTSRIIRARDRVRWRRPCVGVGHAAERRDQHGGACVRGTWSGRAVVRINPVTSLVHCRRPDNDRGMGRVARRSRSLVAVVDGSGAVAFAHGVPATRGMLMVLLMSK